ncbi:MAG: hypothetical protein HJHJAOHD_01589 [Flavobacteriales bacterium]|nr:hypothetical protein [Flavobacteriales bacterium]
MIYRLKSKLPENRIFLNLRRIYLEYENSKKRWHVCSIYPPGRNEVET